LLEIGSIFGTLGSDPRMRSAVTQALAKLYEVGARQAVEALRPA
jgi:fructuronate reductase